MPIGRHTIKPGTPEHGTREHGTPVEHWNTGGTLAEQRNTGRTIRMPQNSGTYEEQRNNITTKQRQEIPSILSNDILSRYHNKIQNKKAILARRIFMEKWNPVRRCVPCNKFAQENEKQNTYASVVIFWS